MPACLETNNPFGYKRPGGEWLSGRAVADLRGQSPRHINIGLLNNMPDGALEPTERQFLSLLDAASGPAHVRLSLYSLPGVPRSGVAANRIKTCYSSVEDLWNTRLDGIIVTGREPLASCLVDELYWKSLTRTIEWAQENTYSAVWSCLAAHAALLHCDGIRRVKSKQKYCGVFGCAHVSDHALMEGAPRCFNLPHSRWNGVSKEEDLVRCGYRILTRSAEAGVDTFVKQYHSLFVFFQGHPEYESNTLLLEYRRDIARYLRGESEIYPTLPLNYFDREASLELEAFQSEALRGRSEALIEKANEIMSRIRVENTWRWTAICLYRNWLEYICAQKGLQVRVRRAAAKADRGVGAPLVSIAPDNLHSAHTTKDERDSVPARVAFR